MFSVALVVVVVVGVGVGQARPPPPVGYFPSYPPWGSSDPNLKADDYILSYKENFRDLSDTKKEKTKFPIYSKAREGGGFVPELKALDDVYWWKKRYYDNDDDANRLTDMLLEEAGGRGVVGKRDYTAGQLVNMLKALAKARRQRNIRVTGKALRFGISK